MVPANFSDLAERVKPGVVNIQVIKKVQNAGFVFPDFPGGPFGEDSPFGRFFDGNQLPEQKQEGTGSGFIIDVNGHIITNNHVVENADQIKVKLASGEEYDASVVGRDSKTDLALLKIDGAGDLLGRLGGVAGDVDARLGHRVHREGVQPLRRRAGVGLPGQGIGQDRGRSFLLLL